jgi:peptidoglycan/LPS O-acetylase OafA/YrhL
VKEYEPAFDGLRAVAVTLVIATHVGVTYAQGGVVGVDLFFVLSGFLITTLLLAEREARGGIDLAAFYVRRALRLLPALLVLVAATDAYLGLDRVNPARGATLRATPAVLLDFANWRLVFAGAGSLGWFWHTWSLAVEWQFYVVWPLVLAAALARGWSSRRAATILGTALVASVLLRAAAAAARGSGLVFATPMVADQLLYGCGLALLLRSRWAARVGHAAAVGATLAIAYVVGYLAVAGWQRHASDGVARSLVGLATAVVIARVITVPQARIARLLSLRPLVRLGRVSYGVYLWHLLASLALAERIAFPHALRPVYWVAAYALTLAAAALSYRIVEAPALGLKRRFRRASPVAPCRELTVPGGGGSDPLSPV